MPRSLWRWGRRGWPHGLDGSLDQGVCRQPNSGDMRLPGSQRAVVRPREPRQPSPAFRRRFPYPHPHPFAAPKSSATSRWATTIVSNPHENPPTPAPSRKCRQLSTATPRRPHSTTRPYQYRREPPFRRRCQPRVRRPQTSPPPSARGSHAYGPHRHPQRARPQGDQPPVPAVPGTLESNTWSSTSSGSPAVDSRAR